MNSGVYIIANKLNNHMYVGSAACSLEKRWKKHTNELKKHIHHSPILQQAWDKYGEENFDFFELEFVDRDELIAREQYYLDVLSPEYNVCKVAGKAGRLGLKSSEEHKRKISETLKGHKHSEERKRNRSIALKKWWAERKNGS